MKRNLILILLGITLFSCGKKTDELSVEQKQIQQEKREPLKFNQLLEQEGLRFIVSSAVTDTAIIQIELKLYQGSGTTKSPTPIPLTKDDNMNYSIRTELMQDNTEYTLVIEYNKILQNAPYELFSEGFTSLFGNKEFKISGNSFSTASAGTSKDLMLIKKGILKFTVFAL